MRGGIAGLAIARVALQVVRTVNPGNIPRLEAITLDGTVLAFTFGVSILTGLLFGLVPAIRAARVDLNSSLKAGGRNAQGEGGFGSARPRLRGLLVVAEVAISLVLLVGAGLLLRSFVRLQAVSPGFQADGVISMRVGPSSRQFANREAALAHYGPIGEALSAVPGVSARGAVTSLPFTSSVGWGSINVEGWTPQPGQELQVDQRSASPDYFRAMGVPLLQGRAFTEADMRTAAEQVAIIDEKFAQRFWPAGDAVGHHVWFDPARKIRIVGVVGTVKQYGLDVDGRIVVYRPGLWANYQIARTSGDPLAVGRAMIRKIQEMDPTITVFDVQTMSARMSQSMARQRFSTIMLGSFAVFALVLAIVGVYGVMSTLLFGVSATDVATFTGVPLILIATAAIASYIPALRATRVDPVVALREE